VFDKSDSFSVSIYVAIDVGDPFYDDETVEKEVKSILQGDGSCDCRLSCYERYQVGSYLASHLMFESLPFLTRRSRTRKDMPPVALSS